MTDPGFKLGYTWEDLRPVHPLFITVLIAEAIGAMSNLLLQGTGNWYEAVWFGGALAAFPGFVVGLPIQSLLRPGSIGANRSMVFFMGAVTLLLFIVGLALPRAVS